jgi:hypothetical protein
MAELVMLDEGMSVDDLSAAFKESVLDLPAPDLSTWLE